MALIDRQYLPTPFYGSRRMTAWLQTQGHMVNCKRVQRLMRLMGIEAIYQRDFLHPEDLEAGFRGGGFLDLQVPHLVKGPSKALKVPLNAVLGPASAMRFVW